MNITTSSIVFNHYKGHCAFTDVKWVFCCQHLYLIPMCTDRKALDLYALDDKYVEQTCHMTW